MLHTDAAIARTEPSAADEDFKRCTSIRPAGAAAGTVRYTIAESALGRMLVAATAQGVCNVAFDDDDEALLHGLHCRQPVAKFIADGATLSEAVEALLGYLQGSTTMPCVPVDVPATAFQQRVWQSLQAIPRGETRTYTGLAASLGQPTAARAVARACASNPLAIIVPCHRAVGSDGSLTGYRWGLHRKRLLLALEGRQMHQTGAPPDRDPCRCRGESQGCLVYPCI